MARRTKNETVRQIDNTIYMSEDMADKLSEMFPQGFIFVPLSNQDFVDSEKPASHDKTKTYLNWDHEKCYGFGEDKNGRFSIVVTSRGVVASTSEPVFEEEQEKPVAKTGRRRASK